MTHMAWVPERWVDAASETLSGLAERHPSRTILLFPLPREAATRSRPRSISAASCAAAWSARSAPRSSRSGCAGAAPRRRPASSSRSSSRTCPSSCAGAAKLPSARTELEQLVDVADRLDRRLAEWSDPERRLERLAELLDRVAVSDIAWASDASAGARRSRRSGRTCADASALRVAGPEAEAVAAHAAGSRSRLGRERRARARARRGDRARRGGRQRGRAGALERAVVERPPLRTARDLRSRPDLRGGGTELLVGPDLAELTRRLDRRSGGRRPAVPDRPDGRVDAWARSTSGSPRCELDWANWHVWWSDERDRAAGRRPDSNERMAREKLLSRVSVPEEQIHPLRSTDVSSRSAST